MKAAIITAPGRPPTYGELPEPTAGAGRVVAEVRAAAVKNIERALADGSHYASRRLALPGPIGLDAVVRLPDGRRAYAGAAPPGGAMAERMAVDPAQSVELPDGVDDAAAAALPNAGVSAWFALELTGRIAPGHSVLILGATGVTGSLAVQLAKHRFGAGRVVAVGRDRSRLDRLTGLGADTVVRAGGPHGIGAELRRLHEERPFDLVIDYLWGAPAEQALTALAGDDLAAAYHPIRYVQVGEMAGPDARLPAAVLRSAGIELVGQGGGSVTHRAYDRVLPEVIPELFARLADGRLTVDTVTRPLAEVAEAWAAPVPSGTRVVLTP